MRSVPNPNLGFTNSLYQHILLHCVDKVISKEHVKKACQETYKKTYKKTYNCTKKNIRKTQVGITWS